MISIKKNISLFVQRLVSVGVHTYFRGDCKLARCQSENILTRLKVNSRRKEEKNGYGDFHPEHVQRHQSGEGPVAVAERRRLPARGPAAPPLRVPPVPLPASGAQFKTLKKAWEKIPAKIITN